MQLFLFGGAEFGEAAAELKMIEWVIKSIAPKQLLHVPFARTKDGWREERNGNRFHRNIHIPEVEYLNANNPDDVAKAIDPVIFISGWKEHENLINSINANPKLVELIRNASYIIGESAGSKVLWTHYGSEDKEGNTVLLPSLGVIKNTVLEWHYTQRNKESKLDYAMQETGAHYGVGIDSLTAIVFTLDEFPEKYSKLWDGTILVKHNAK